MPTEWIHRPWDAPMTVLNSAGVELGSNYPRPIIDIDTARERLDDAVGMMWEVNRAAKVAQSSSLGEVVADNLISMNSFDIPKVIIKKDVSCSHSSLDQRVPSFHNVKNSSRNKEVKVLNEESSCPVAEKTKDVDLISTAESSSARKRSISESHCAVPTHVCTPTGDPLQELDSVGQHFSDRFHSDHSTHQIPDEKVVANTLFKFTGDLVGFLSKYD